MENFMTGDPLIGMCLWKLVKLFTLSLYSRTENFLEWQDISHDMSIITYHMLTSRYQLIDIYVSDR